MLSLCLLFLVKRITSQAALTPMPTTSTETMYFPETDIGCNYINFGGIAVPTDYCMQVLPPKDDGDLRPPTPIFVKWNCNDDYNGINIILYPDALCEKSAIFTDDWTDALSDFNCNEKYKFKKCDEVSINAYPTDQCDGKLFSEIRLITEQCLPAYNNDSDITQLYEFKQVLCTETSVTVSVYEMPFDQWGNCDDRYLITDTNLEEGPGSLDGDEAGCIDVNGCGDYKSEHDIIDIGCNYINFNGFGIPMDACMYANTDLAKFSYKVYCNDTFDGVVFGAWFTSNCRGPPLEEVDVTQDFQYVCQKEYVESSACNTMQLQAFTNDTCDGSEYYTLDLITEVCLYDDIDVFYRVDCDGTSAATLSQFETTDDECNMQTLMSTQSLVDAFEVWDIAFGCAKVERCESGVTTTSSTTQPIQTRTPITSKVTHDKGVPKKSKVDKGEAKQSTIIVVSVIGGVVVLGVLVAGVWFGKRFCKQKKDVEMMVAIEATHSAQTVQNPYGQIDSINDGGRSKADALL